MGESKSKQTEPFSLLVEQEYGSIVTSLQDIETFRKAKEAKSAQRHTGRSFNI
jgi:hypothetical protein